MLNIMYILRVKDVHVEFPNNVSLVVVQVVRTVFYFVAVTRVFRDTTEAGKNVQGGRDR